MACDADSLLAESKCLVTGLSDHELLAYIAYQLAVNAGVEPTPANLVSLSKCVSSLYDNQLLASIAYTQCAALMPT